MRRCWNCQNYQCCDKHKYGVVRDCTSYVRTIDQQRIRVNLLNSAIMKDESENDGCSIFPADTLPGGWTWHCWNDWTDKFQTVCRRSDSQTDATIAAANIGLSLNARGLYYFLHTLRKRVKCGIINI